MKNEATVAAQFDRNPETDSNLGTEARYLSQVFRDIPRSLQENALNSILS